MDCANAGRFKPLLIADGEPIIALSASYRCRRANITEFPKPSKLKVAGSTPVTRFTTT